MAECRHGMDEASCATCTSPSRSAGAPTGSRAGQSFALIYAPSLNRETFLHLNRQGDSWKIRHYPSPHGAPRELAQAGAKSTRMVLDLDELEIVHEVAYPYSTSPSGVSVEDHRYWFDEIAKTNSKFDIGTGS